MKRPGTWCYRWSAHTLRPLLVPQSLPLQREKNVHDFGERTHPRTGFEVFFWDEVSSAALNDPLGNHVGTNPPVHCEKFISPYSAYQLRVMVDLICVPELLTAVLRFATVTLMLCPVQRAFGKHLSNE